MTQLELDTLVYCICEAQCEGIGEYKLVVRNGSLNDLVEVVHPIIENIKLPWEVIRLQYTAKERGKIVLELIDQIVKYGDDWLSNEEDFEGNLVDERFDRIRKQ